ncbi:MAG: hypothetical protein P4L83_03265 [Nevskia sp.]|nr:hypothetical protein [Nevskia sp.]
MSAQSPSAAPKEFRLFLELVIVVGLPILSIFIGSTLAIVAYTKGFTALPEPPAQVSHHR